MITLEDFKKLSLKIARIKEVAGHPDADKLYVVKLDIGGEEKQVVAGIKKAYTPESLVGRLVVVVDNLEPAVIRGVESNGMILASNDGENMAVLSPDKDIVSGSIVK
ncbi:MAG: methionine--tRNA ligase subunit beta [Candidatus Omnitrophica bacterium]|nr:methionine--tRNA ligase subunit beta [Candidatus Omnitrophota bacterium]